jgi:DNA invertase Pin-like site-specific DNA recombinase
MSSYPNDGTNRLRYIGYVRKSTEDQERQALSIEAQKDKIRERFPDLDIVDILEESKSAFEPGKRPILQQVLDLLDSGKVDGVAAWHPDRLSRNELDASALTWRIRKGALKDLKFANYTFDDSPEGMMMLQMTMSQSQYFSAKLSKDVKRGNEKKRKLGGVTGKAPEGYLNDRINHTVYADPERFPLLRRAVDYYLTGEHSVQQILNLLNNQWGYRTLRRKHSGGQPLSRSALYYIFRNVRYAGWIPDPYDEDRLYPAAFPPLMTQQEYDKLQLLLGRQGNKRFAARKQFVLRGFLRCGECGCMITAEDKVKHYKNGTSQQFTYYHCTRKRPCTQRGYVREGDLFQQCVEELDHWELDPELGEWSMAALNRLAHTEIPESKSAEAMQQQAIEEIEAQYDTLLDMSTRRLIDEPTFVKKARELKAKLKELRKSRASAGQQTMSWYEYLTDLVIKFTNANEKFVTGDLAAKKELLLAIGQNPVVLDGKLHITPNEWLIPLREQTVYFRRQIEQVRTVPQQIRKSLLDALRLEWLAILDQVRTCFLFSGASSRPIRQHSEPVYYRRDRQAA